MGQRLAPYPRGLDWKEPRMRPVFAAFGTGLALLAVTLLVTTQAGAQKKEKPELLVLEKDRVVVESSISGDSPKDKARKGRRYKAFDIALKAGSAYQFDMTSAEIDTFLRLENAKGKLLAEDDDGGGD